MGTVPTPARPLDGVALAQASTDTWWNAQNFLLKPPSCRVALNSSVTGWAAATTAPITWNVESWDVVQSGDTEMHSTSTNPERITIRTAGRYRVHAMATCGVGTSAMQIQLQLFKNGAASGVASTINCTASTNYTPTLTDEISCLVGDYLTLTVTPSATGLNVTGASPYDTHLTVTWVSN